MQEWPHQTEGIRGVLDAFDRGVQRVCLTSPTGGGKSHMFRQIARAFLDRKRRVVLYSNRTYLIEQLSDGLLAAGFDHGVRAAGAEDGEFERPLQISSIQTETARVVKKQVARLHACDPGDLAIIDEAHLHGGKTAVEIFERHVAGGAFLLGGTATPLGLEDLYDELIVAGRPSQLRECGALVEARHYGCDEPDLRQFKKLREGQDPTAKQQRSAIMTPDVMGRIWKHYQRLNPEHRPCILFGPDVEGSLWFAEQFCQQGIRAAHLDGDDVWLDGEFHRSDRKLRERVRAGSKDGSIPVVCNRYVLREGIDWPWVSHIILAFVAGSLQTFLQIGGRGLRTYPGKTHCIIQDHGAAWLKHGSLNEDRHWSLAMTPEIAFELRAKRLRDKKPGQPKEPFLCPGCQRVWGGGSLCNPTRGGCGYVLDVTRKSRPVVSTDGTLRELGGDAFQARRITKRKDGQKLWERMYHRARSESWNATFAMAAAFYFHEYHGWPDPDWPLMPIDEMDYYRRVRAVPPERLH